MPEDVFVSDTTEKFKRVTSLRTLLISKNYVKVMRTVDESREGFPFRSSFVHVWQDGQPVKIKKDSVI